MLPASSSGKFLLSEGTSLPGSCSTTWECKVLALKLMLLLRAWPWGLEAKDKTELSETDALLHQSLQGVFWHLGDFTMTFVEIFWVCTLGRWVRSTSCLRVRCLILSLTLALEKTLPCQASLFLSVKGKSNNPKGNGLAWKLYTRTLKRHFLQHLASIKC